MPTIAELRNRLERMVAASKDPALDPDEITQALEAGRIADIYGRAPDPYINWEPNTAYEIGDVRTPTVRDGYLYAVVNVTGAGLSGQTEPPFISGGVTIPDGDIDWIALGVTAWDPTYDLNKAASEGWMIKAGKSSSRANQTAFGQTINRREVHENCLRMADYYANKVIATIKIIGAGNRSRY